MNRRKVVEAFPIGIWEVLFLVNSGTHAPYEQRVSRTEHCNDGRELNNWFSSGLAEVLHHLRVEQLLQGRMLLCWVLQAHLHSPLLMLHFLTYSLVPK